MKSFRLSGVVCAVLSFLSLFVFTGAKKEGSIKEITKPYLGVYTCEQILFGGEDRTDGFSSLTIELKANGTFVLSAKDGKGKKYTGGGNYTYDGDSGKVSFRSALPGVLPEGKILIEKGTLRLIARYGDKLLFVIFKR